MADNRLAIVIVSMSKLNYDKLASAPRAPHRPPAATARLDPPLYARIVDALAADIAEGRLVPGSRLPTQRELAERVGTTVATVTRSYTEARRRGLVDATVGRGTFVRETVYAPAARGPADLTINSLAPAPFVGAMLASFGACVDAAAGDALVAYQPHAGRGAASRGGRRMAARAARPRRARRGGRHRRRAARDARRARDAHAPARRRARRAAHVSRRQVAGQSSAPAARAGRHRRGGHVARVARRRGGADERAKVVYTMPTLQNPTAATMSAARRRAIAEVIAAQGADGHRRRSVRVSRRRDAARRADSRSRRAHQQPVEECGGGPARGVPARAGHAGPAARGGGVRERRDGAADDRGAGRALDRRRYSRAGSSTGSARS